ncbi:MAG: hypothetical protein ACFFE8_00535 [Candidatus Heimdallarchaeota archaeon]
MNGSRISPEDHKRFLYLRIIIDWLKSNGHRIAHHVLSRTSGPLAGRSDIKSLLPLIDGVVADILTLDSESRVTLVKSVESDELIAHFPGDMSLKEGLDGIQAAGLKNIHFIFVSTGILAPTLLQENFEPKYPEVTKITFLETRFEAEPLHRIGNPTIYMRKAISQIRQMETSFTENSDLECDCGGTYWQGSYKISYWGKSTSLDYSICPNCATQIEPPGNADTIMNFVQGFSAK